MAQNANSVVNVSASAGSDNSGGGFSLAGNTYGITDLVGSNANTTTPSVSSASYTFVAGDVGDYVHIASGSNWLPGLYPIKSVAAGAATLGQPDPAVGTFSGCASTASPTVGSATVMRIRHSGAFTNGTNLTVDGTDNTKVNPDGYTITNADVGNWIQITTTGTGAAFTVGFYQITVVTTGASQRWKLDRSPAATSSAGATWAMGGPLQTLSKLSSAMVSSNKGWVQSGAYSTTSTITFGQASVNWATGAMPSAIYGYKTLWGDIAAQATESYSNNGSRPVLSLSTNSSLTALLFSNNGWDVRNLIVDCAGLAASVGINLNGNNSIAKNCWVRNFTIRGINVSGSGTEITNCELSGGTSAAAEALLVGNASINAYRNNVHDCACPGIVVNADGTVGGNLIVNCTGASSDGIQSNGSGGRVLNNTIYNCGRNGLFINSTSWRGTTWRNNIIAKAGGAGAKGATAAGAPAGPWWDGNAFWSNTGGNRVNMDDGAIGTSPTNAVNAAAPYANVLDVALSADPFVRATVPVADLAVDASNNLKVTSSGYNFVSGDVGATIYVTTSTGGWNGPAEFTIASISGTAAILNASPGATSSSAGNWYFNNFRLNSTASAGASLRAGGTPGAFPGVSMLGYLDFGAAQHQDPAAPPVPPLIYGA